jgi:putative transposase
MSQPRLIVPGATYLITRRTLLRYMLFRPDPEITQLIVYSLAVSARRFGIQVHALCAMSTHVHLVLTDVHGRLPSFLHLFHRLVALGTKVLRAWEGPVWDHDATSVVHLLTRQAVIEKIAYTLANPVAAGLVRHAHEWPGATVRVDKIGCGVLYATRPDVYFDPTNSRWPKEEALPLTLPPSIDESDPADFHHDVAVALAREEAQAHASLARRGLSAIGSRRAATVSPLARATSLEELRGRNPTFAVGHGNGNMLHRAVAALRAFRSSYREALAVWRTGMRLVVFPAGTWWMRVFHAVAVGGGALAS